jgi:ABC-type sugar transport system permease subunit
MIGRPPARTVAAWIVGWWALASLAIVWRTHARVEYALAAREARSLAESVDENLQPRRAPVRETVAAGRIGVVTRLVERRIGVGAARRVAAQERVLVLASGFERFVSIPLKDQDAWNIVGAVVLRAEWTRHMRSVWVVVLAATLLALGLAVRGVRRAEDDSTTPPLLLMAEPIAVLAIGMAALTLLTRRVIDDAAVVLPPSSVSRFDPLAMALPGERPAALLLTIALLAAVSALALVAWSVSKRRSAALRRETLTALGFLSPATLHLALFTIGPLLFTAYLSLHRWDLLDVERPFVGLANYRELLGDARFWGALRNTAVYALYVPVTMVLALGAAVLLNRPLRGVRLLRALVFLPTIVSYVAIAMVWQWIYHADYGLLNYFIRALGGAGRDWLGNPATALPALMVVSAWVQLGYQMVVYLAGLQGVPAWLHEAATLDGASPWQRFWKISWPLLRPVSLYLLVTGVIWSFQVFSLVYVMTEGGPVHATDVVVYQIYQNAWEFRRMGYASAMSWVLCAVLVVLTVFQWRWLNRRIDYAS